MDLRNSAMSSNISPENERYLEDAVARGVFPSRGDALNSAVELLKRQEQLVRDVNAGIAEIDRGEVLPLDMEEIKTARRAWRSEKHGQEER